MKLSRFEVEAKIRSAASPALLQELEWGVEDCDGEADLVDCFEEAYQDCDDVDSNYNAHRSSILDVGFQLGLCRFLTQVEYEATLPVAWLGGKDRCHKHQGLYVDHVQGLDEILEE